MARPCPSCAHTADECSYPGEARPGCLLDKRNRDKLTKRLESTPIQYRRAKLKLRGLFPDAKRIELSPYRLKIEGLPLLLLPALGSVLKVLAKVWGEDAHVAPEFSFVGELLRIERG